MKSYIESQLAALAPCDDHYLIQLHSDAGGKTNHLNITPGQLTRVKKVLIGAPSTNMLQQATAADLLTKQQTVLLQIQELLSGKEWDSGTASEVAEVMEAAGYVIAAYGDEE